MDGSDTDGGPTDGSGGEADGSVEAEGGLDAAGAPDGDAAGPADIRWLRSSRTCSSSWVTYASKALKALLVDQQLDDGGYR